MSVHLLVVDDQADLITLFKGFFSSVGYRVSTANDGLAALDLDENDAADILVTDLTMPKMSGQALIAELRRRRPDLPVIVMSGYGDEFDLADDRTVVLAKPVSLMLMKEQLEKLLSQSG